MPQPGGDHDCPLPPHIVLQYLNSILEPSTDQKVCLQPPTLQTLLLRTPSCCLKGQGGKAAEACTAMAADHITMWEDNMGCVYMSEASVIYHKVVDTLTIAVTKLAFDKEKCRAATLGAGSVCIKNLACLATVDTPSVVTGLKAC